MVTPPPPPPGAITSPSFPLAGSSCTTTTRIQEREKEKKKGVGWYILVCLFVYVCVYVCVHIYLVSRDHGTTKIYDFSWPLNDVAPKKRKKMTCENCGFESV